MMSSVDDKAVQSLLAEMMPEPQKREVPPIERFAAALDGRGWKRDIAGDDDFNAAVKAWHNSVEYGLGLIVSGKYGCGKTSLMNAILPKRYLFRIDLGDSYDLVKLDRSWREYRCYDPFNMHIYLDDLGAEPTKSEYGSYGEAVADFVIQWHLHHNPECYMFISTNLNGDEIDYRYGGRFLSRLKDLCVPLRLNGKDKRQWKL